MRSLRRPSPAFFLVGVLLPLLAACGGAAKMESAMAPSAPMDEAVTESAPAEASGEMYALTATTAGGGGAPQAQAPTPPMPKVAPATTPASPPPTGTGSGTGTPSTAPPDTRTPEERRLLVYRAELSLAVYQVAPNLAAVEKIAKDSGGYLALREDRRIVIRVPKARFEEALAKVEAVGDVLHRNVVAEDVSDRFQDLSARLRNLKAVRDKLEGFLVKANVKESIEIQNELTKITEQIELIEGKLKLLSDQIAYSTITVNFAPKSDSVKKSDFRLPFPVLDSLGLQKLLRLYEPSSSVR